MHYISIKLWFFFKKKMAINGKGKRKESQVDLGQLAPSKVKELASFSPVSRFPSSPLSPSHKVLTRAQALEFADILERVICKTHLRIPSSHCTSFCYQSWEPNALPAPAHTCPGKRSGPWPESVGSLPTPLNTVAFAFPSECLPRWARPATQGLARRENSTSVCCKNKPILQMWGSWGSKEGQGSTQGHAGFGLPPSSLSAKPMMGPRQLEANVTEWQNQTFSRALCHMCIQSSGRVATLSPSSFLFPLVQETVRDG